jgi:protein-histidine N-methyltransferase
MSLMDCQIGCGTSIPSASLFHTILSKEATHGNVELHLQDYNRSVLELVTLPNLFLAWCMLAHFSSSISRPL